MSNEMKELELEWSGPATGEIAGFSFKQICANSSGYLYEITDSEQNRHYEVFRRIEQQEGTRCMQGIDVKMEAKVLYPKSGSFGKTAWCIKDRAKAEAYFEELGVE